MPKVEVPLKAIILVGGEGTRLHPLTYDLPKSMVPVLNRPFLEHTLAYLKRSGVNDIVLAMSYLSGVIQSYFGDGQNLGIQLTYAVESQPLGTAGAVKNAEQFVKGTFAVFNGDIFTDLDLADMLAFHRRQKAKATIALTRVDNPCAFGVVETDGAGKVLRFVEKPSPGQVTTHWINAGIYILEPEVLEHIPANRHYMFEKGLFPLLLQLGEPVYSYLSNGYWLDMGTPEKYFCLNRDLLQAKAKSLLFRNLSRDKVLCDQKVIIHPSAQIMAPVLIARGCEIGQRVQIRGPVVIGPDSYIADDAIIEEAVLWEKVRIGAGAVLKQAIVGSHTVIAASDQVINRVVTTANQVHLNKTIDPAGP